MSLILKQEPANTIATPPAGKSTLFVNDQSVMSVKSPDGNVTTFPTVQGANTQVFFNDAGSINGNANLTFDKTTSTMSVTNLSVTGTLDAGDISVSSIANGTSNVDIVGVSGNVTTSVNGTANVFIVSATGANVTGTFSASGNANVGNLGVTGSVIATTFSGDLLTGAQPNITSTGTLVSLSVSGNANSGNLGTTGVFATTLSATGNANIGNIGTGGLITATGNISGGNIITGGFVSATGNVTAPYFIGNGSQLTGIDATAIQNGNSNVQVFPNTIVTTSVAGNANVFAVLGTGIQANGTVSASGNVTAGNVDTGGLITATGNVTGGNLITSGNVFAGQLVANSGAYDTRLSVSTSTGIIEANSAGNATQFLPSGQVRLAGASAMVMSGTSDGSQLVLGTTQTDVNQLRGGDVTLQVGTTGTAVSVLRLQNSGNLVAPAAISAAGNVTGGNVITGGVVTATGNVSGGNLTTGGAVAATGNVSGGNLTTAGLVSATGNVSGGNLTTAGVISSTGNANVGNLGTGGLVTATGNISGGNINTAGLVSATGNVVAGANVVTDLIVGKTTNVTITAAGTNQNINLVPTGTGTVNVGTFRISNVATPTDTADAATKQYVDNLAASGIHYHEPVFVESPDSAGSLNATYNNGTSGVGATLTNAGTQAALTIDGVLMTVGKRVLIYNQTNQFENGVYVVTTVGTGSTNWVLTRASDADTYNPFSPNSLGQGDAFFVTNGNTGVGETYICNTVGTITFGTTAITFAQISDATLYTAGTGLALNGTTFSISNTAVTTGTYGGADVVSTITVNQQGQLTSASNTVIQANAANLSGTTLKSTVVSSSLTSVGTLTSLSISGNANIGNIGSAGVLTVTGNANVGNLGTGGLITATGNITGGNVIGTLVTGTLTTAAQPNITSVGTLGSLVVTGNLSAGNVTGTHYGAATGLTGIPGANVTGTVPLATSATTAGTVTTAAQPNITSLGTLSTISVSGNANIGNVGAGAGIYTTLSASGNVNGGNLVSTGTIGATGATHLGNTFTTGGNTTTATVTGNFSLSTGSRFQATYA